MLQSLFRASPKPPTLPDDADELLLQMAKMGFVEVPDLDAPTPPPKVRPVDYQVEMTDRLVIRAKKIEPHPVSVFTIGDHRYTGITRKPAKGGGLFLDEQKEENLILRGNIYALIPRKQDLYIFTGAHRLYGSCGAIYVIRICATQFKPERITLLPAAPAAVYLHDFGPLDDDLLEIFAGTMEDVDLQKFVIAGWNCIMLFRPDNHLEIIVHGHPAMCGFRANSIVRDDSFYYFGSLRGVACVPTSWDLLVRNPFRCFVPLIPEEVPGWHEAQASAQ